MALDDVQHVEAVAIIRHLLEGDPQARVAAEVWLEKNHPPPDAYLAAAASLAEPEGMGT